MGGRPGSGAEQGHEEALGRYVSYLDCGDGFGGGYTWHGVHAQSLSRVQLFETPWTVAQQTPLSMGFSRQEYWSGSPFPSPEDLPDLGIELRSPALQATSLPSEVQGRSMV